MEEETCSKYKDFPVICLTVRDFDPSIGDILKFSGVNGVVFFGADWCGHCKAMKPKFGEFSKLLSQNEATDNVRAFFVDCTKDNGISNLAKEDTWGYSVNGYPTIVSYHKGKFYSEYGMDKNNPSVFRTPGDLLEYASGIGKAEIVWT